MRVEVAKAKREFFRLNQMPGIVVAIDCTHVQVQPKHDVEWACVNRKDFQSINVQLMCTTDCRFVNVVAKSPGSVHDAQIFRQSTIGRQLKAGELPNVQILDDSGYALSTYLLTPLRNP